MKMEQNLSHFLDFCRKNENQACDQVPNAEIDGKGLFEMSFDFLVNSQNLIVN